MQVKVIYRGWGKDRGMDGMEFYIGVGVTLMAVGSVLLNCLLFSVVVTIKNRKGELNFSIGMAVVGILKPVITLSTTAFVLVTNPNIELMHEACKIKGPIDFVCTFGNMALVAIVARLRCATVLGRRVQLVEWLILVLFSTAYVFVIGVVGSKGLFQASPSGVDCSPDSSKNLSSAVLVFLLGFALLYFSASALVCYSRILYFLRTQRKSLIKASSLIPKRTPTFKPVFIRTFAVCSIFLMFVIPASALIMAEAIARIPPFVSLAISICLALDAMANPCLVLFAHSIIYSHLKQSFQNLFSTGTDAFTSL